MRLLVLAALAAGCSFSPPEGAGGAFACSAAEPDCPPGTSCIEGRCRVPADAAPEPTGFGFRQKLRLDNLDNDAVIGFPLLVALDPQVFDYNGAQADGDDLRFFDPDSTPLPHEVESWVPGGRSILWVRVPEVTGRSDEDYIWLYYGDPALGPPAGAGREVWSAYQAVYHMGPRAALDSGLLAIDGQVAGTEVVEGPIGEASEFDGTSDHVRFGPDPPLLNAVPGITLEAWVRPDGLTGADEVVVAVATDGVALSRAQIKVLPDAGVRVVFRTVDASEPSAVHVVDAKLQLGEWSWIAAVADLPAGAVSVTVNETTSGSTSSDALDDRTPATDPDQAAISVDEAGDEFFAGGIDEVRIAGRALSPDWIALQHASMTRRLISFEPAAPP